MLSIRRSISLFPSVNARPWCPMRKSTPSPPSSQTMMRPTVSVDKTRSLVTGSVHPPILIQNSTVSQRWNTGWAIGVVCVDRCR